MNFAFKLFIISVFSFVLAFAEETTVINTSPLESFNPGGTETDSSTEPTESLGGDFSGLFGDDSTTTDDTIHESCKDKEDYEVLKVIVNDKTICIDKDTIFEPDPPKSSLCQHRDEMIQVLSTFVGILTSSGL